jgi:ABC-type phosphate transport system substrate-binding protein
MRFIVSTIAGAVVLAACGGGQTPSAQSGADQKPTDAEIEQAQKPCGSADSTQQADLSSDKATDAFAPCAKGGAKDYSALVHIEPVEDGVHIIIEATDEDVTLLGPDVKSRDAVIVYPKGKGSASVEVPLEKTKTGYHGDKIVFWNDLDKITDEGTKIDIAVYDHDKASGETEELHVSVGLSTGKSCEKAQDENPQQVSMGKTNSRPDLTNAQLGAPINNANAAAACGLPDATHAKICVLVRNGKPLGVSVNVDPRNNKMAACIDRRMRRLAFPVDDRPNTVTYSY